MIEVKHGGVCLKLKKAIAEEHIEEATAWLKDCAKKIHEHHMKEIDEAMKNLWGRLQIADPTGEIYGRVPEGEL